MVRRVFSSKKAARAKEHKIWAEGRRARVIQVKDEKYAVFVDGKKR